MVVVVEVNVVDEVVVEVVVDVLDVTEEEADVELVLPSLSPPPSSA